MSLIGALWRPKCLSLIHIFAEHHGLHVDGGAPFGRDAVFLAVNDGAVIVPGTEHGGDPASVKFCNTLGLTYVSCSPYCVPTARLAAAQAALEQA